MGINREEQISWAAELSTRARGETFAAQNESGRQNAYVERVIKTVPVKRRCLPERARELLDTMRRRAARAHCAIRYVKPISSGLTAGDTRCRAKKKAIPKVTCCEEIQKFHRVAPAQTNRGTEPDEFPRRAPGKRTPDGIKKQVHSWTSIAKRRWGGRAVAGEGQCLAKLVEKNLIEPLQQGAPLSASASGMKACWVGEVQALTAS